MVGLRGSKRALRPARWVRRQPGSFLEEGSRRGQAPTRLGPNCRALELVGHLFVEPRCRVGAVPRPAIGIGTGIGGVRQSLVDVPALRGRRRPVDGRSHERMAEPHLPGEVDQSGRDRRQRRIGPDAELAGCPPHQHRIADRLDRRHREQQPGRWREGFQPPTEAVLDPARQCCGVGQPEPARQLLGRQAMRQLQQGERVSAGLGHDPVADSFVYRTGGH